MLSTACDNGTYGFDCNKTCGHCRDVNQCMHSESTEIGPINLNDSTLLVFRFGYFAVQFFYFKRYEMFPYRFDDNIFFLFKHHQNNTFKIGR